MLLSARTASMPTSARQIRKFCKYIRTHTHKRCVARERGREVLSDNPRGLRQPAGPGGRPRRGRSGRHRTSAVRPWRLYPGIGSKIGANLAIFAKFWRARSRLYQNEILQKKNMRSAAFFKLYKICILSHRCNLKIFAKNRFEKTAIFAKFQQKNCKCRKICKICKILPNFKNFSLIVW